MPVYLVHRDPYVENCKAWKAFPMSNLLEWAQFIWDIVHNIPNEEEAYKEIKKFIGFNIYGINDEYFRESVLDRPVTMEEAIFAIDHILVNNGLDTNNKNFIQILDRDSAPCQYAVYLFDEIYLQENPGMVSYLLTEDFRMPGTNKSNHSVPQGLHLCFDNYWYTNSLSDHAPSFYIPGIGLKDLPLYLSKTKPDKEWPRELLFLRILSLDNTGQLKSFEQMIHDYLQYDGNFWSDFPFWYGGRENTFLFDEDILYIQKELKTRAYQDYDPFKENQGLYKVDFQDTVFSAIVTPAYVYNRWIFFESGWAEEYPNLANSINRYFSRWDCLE